MMNVVYDFCMTLAMIESRNRAVEIGRKNSAQGQRSTLNPLAS